MRRPHVQMQAEFAGDAASNLEMVTNPEAPFKLANTADQTRQGIAPGVATALGQAQSSPELLGFITLIAQFPKERGGNPNAQQGQPARMATFPKTVFTLLARTDLKRRFDLLPPNEQTAIGQHLDAWVTAVLNKPGRAFAPDQPVLKQTFLDLESTVPASTIDTSRADWLSNLPERDLLSHHGRQDAQPAPLPQLRHTSVLSDQQHQQRQALDLLRTTLLRRIADAERDDLPLANATAHASGQVRPHDDRGRSTPSVTQVPVHRRWYFWRSEVALSAGLHRSHSSSCRLVPHQIHLA